MRNIIGTILPAATIDITPIHCHNDEHLAKLECIEPELLEMSPKKGYLIPKDKRLE